MFQIANVLQPLIDVCEAILKFWHGIVGDWGFAIILLTFTIRLAILPLTFKMVKSMQRLQVLAPEMKEIQERYKDDRPRQQEEIMKFYRENEVNPLSSCLPLLLQLPFFIALFYLLRSSEFKADLGDDKDWLFIPDLAEPLTGHPGILAIMVVLYIGTQLVASAITAIGSDKTQRWILFGMPFFFTVFIINFEAGLILYWITTNVWTIGQQLLVRKLYPKPEVLKELGREGKDEAKPARPARGKPAREKAAAEKGADAKAARGKAARGKADAAKADGKAGARPAKASGKAAKTSGKAAGVSGDAGNGGPSKPPPTSPRKKRKRSGRRR